MSNAPARSPSPVLTGVFAGPIAGLKYQTPTLSGVTSATGEFQYRADEAITFLVGGIVLGAVEAAPRLNLAQLAKRVDGKLDKLVVDKAGRDGAISFGKWIVGAGFLTIIGSVIIATLHYVGLLRPPA